MIKSNVTFFHQNLLVKKTIQNFNYSNDQNLIDVNYVNL